MSYVDKKTEVELIYDDLNQKPESDAREKGYNEQNMSRKVEIRYRTFEFGQQTTLYPGNHSD
jgi:hypothetical protein